MKNNIKIIFTILMVAVTMASCKKFLEKPPEGQLTEEEALKTEADVVAFSNGIYTLLGDADFYGGRQQVMSELLGDHYLGNRFTGDYSEIYRRQNSFFGGTRDAYYKKAYRVILDANILLRKLDLTTTTRDRIEGEAKFFRAIAHFELVRMFAQPWGYSPDNNHLGVPLRTEFNLTSANRATVSEVYSLIIQDLQAAENLLPDAPLTGTEYTNATKWAAKAFLAKVYFQQNNFEKAFQYAKEVLVSNKFPMDDLYSKRFSQGLSTEGILVIADQQTPQYNPGADLRGNFRSDLGIPGFTFTNQFYTVATAKAADVRKAWYSNTLQTDYNVLTKYNSNFFDLPIVHITEIKLIRAEAGAETGGANLAVAITDINDILTRAYGGTSFNLPGSATAALVISNARAERELEMVGEGNRLQEIKRIGARNGTNVDRRGSVWNCPGFILQFPKGELDANTSFIMNPEGGCF